jgi:hypothetical protein
MDGAVGFTALNKSIYRSERRSNCSRDPLSAGQNNWKLNIRTHVHRSLNNLESYHKIECTIKFSVRNMSIYDPVRRSNCSSGPFVGR